MMIKKISGEKCWSQAPALTTTCTFASPNALTLINNHVQWLITLKLSLDSLTSRIFPASKTMQMFGHFVVHALESSATNLHYLPSLVKYLVLKTADTLLIILMLLLLLAFVSLNKSFEHLTLNRGTDSWQLWQDSTPFQANEHVSLRFNIAEWLIVWVVIYKNQCHSICSLKESRVGCGVVWCG